MFVKICGTTTEEDALLAVALGADAVGFIFAPSMRQIQPGVAADIAKRLPAEILTVGVFQDASPPRVVEVIAATGLKAAQLSGRESAKQCRWIRDRVPLLIKAFPAGHPGISAIDEFGADILMIDGETPGSGQVFDWKLAEGKNAGRRLLLAGGLTPENVAEAIGRVQPWGVDVATGVESRPGHKDPRKLQTFIRESRAAAPVAYESPRDAPYDWQVDR
jgi:phosphoribosylanthranilate isomerase